MGMKNKFFILGFVLFFYGCSFLGYNGYYKLRLYNEENYIAEDRAGIYTINDFRGVWGIVPLIPIFPYYSLSRDSVELRLFNKSEDECPTILHSGDTLASHYFKSEETSICPYSKVCSFEPCRVFSECHYVVAKKWLNESFVVNNLDGSVDSLLIKRFSKFVYKPLGILSL